jgi:hypothetical protein
MRSGNFRSAPEIPCCPFQKLDSCMKRLLSLSSEVLFAHHKAEIKKRRPIIKAAKSQRRAISTPSISNPRIPHVQVMGGRWMKYRCGDVAAGLTAYR